MQNDNKTKICGWLIVPTKYMNLFPETKGIVSTNSHAVSITKLSLNKNKVIVKYKNIWDVMYGESGYQTITVNKDIFDYKPSTTSMLIFGVMIRHKNELVEDGYVEVVDPTSIIK